LTPGQIVGQYSDANAVLHGFLLSQGSFTTIDYPGAIDTRLTGINPEGQIVGQDNASNGLAITFQ